jgi:hypothetical protein
MDDNWILLEIITKLENINPIKNYLMLVNEQQNKVKNFLYLLRKVTGILILLSEYNYKYSSKLVKCYDAKNVCMCVSASLSENSECRDKTI